MNLVVLSHLEPVLFGKWWYLFNTLVSSRFCRFHQKKNNEPHVALHGNFSDLVSAADLIEVSKDVASLIVSTR